VIREIKAAAKKKEDKIARMLARQLVESKKAKTRLYESKAQLNSVSMNVCFRNLLQSISHPLYLHQHHSSHNNWVQMCSVAGSSS